MRTTLNIDAPVLQELKRLQAKEGKPLGKLVSELVLFALNARRAEAEQWPDKLQWKAKRMTARVDIADRDAVYDALLERTDQ